MNSYRLASVLGLPAGVALLTSADQWVEVARRTAGETFHYTPVFTAVIPLANLLYAAVLLGLLWLLIRARSHGVNALYLAAGLLLLFYTPLRLLVFSNFPVALRDMFPFSNTLLAPTRGWSLIGAFIMMMPFWGWLRSRSARQPAAGVEPASTR